MSDKLSTIALLGLLACATPLYAIAYQLQPTLVLVTKAEDDCPLVFSDILLDDVERHGEVVHCIYRR